MRTKLVITIAALLALAALGGVFWLASGDGDSGRRAAALDETDTDEPLTDGVRGSVRWRGPFDCAALPYEALDLVSFKGSTYVAKEATSDCTEPPKEPWDLFAGGGEQGAQGAQGPPGTFTGTFQSPDGKWRLTVSNTGISAEGPGGRLLMNAAGMDIDSAGALAVKGAAHLHLTANATVNLRGSIVRLGCATGGAPVARMGDPTSGNLITQGSSTVVAC